jgi:uncharacterized lipoprotein
VLAPEEIQMAHGPATKADGEDDEFADVRAPKSLRLDIVRGARIDQSGTERKTRPQRATLTRRR